MATLVSLSLSLLLREHGGDGVFPEGLAGGGHVDVAWDEAFGLGLAVCAEERAGGVDESHPGMRRAFALEELVGPAKVGDARELLGRIRLRKQASSLEF
jgi:hypothetical protein